MKAILVIDNPNNCDECPLQDGEKCYARQDWISTISNWKCPLKPMQKKVVNMSKEKDNQYYYDLGFNDCINEIIGEEE